MHSTITYIELYYVNAPKCKWYLYGGYHKNSNLFEISKLTYLTYMPIYLLARQQSEFIVRVISIVITPNISVNIASIKFSINTQYGFTISYYKACYAKEKFME